jgi:metallo-beta-lactamase class B
MKLTKFTTSLLAASICCATQCALAQDDMAQVRTHVENARSAAGEDHAFIFGQLCAGPITAVNAQAPVGQVPGALPTIDAAREWYAEPAQVFDDLYFFGQTVFSVWGLRTTEGWILVDAIFDYSVEAEVVEGMRKLGMDPADIRYVIISHAHGDHDGGAGILQKLGARIVMSEADWELHENGPNKIKATRDVVATDGMEITLGDTTVSVHLTPGHTHGTLSTILPVHDNGTPHVAALWGGTLFNFRDAPDDPRDSRLGVYAESAAKFRGISTAAGADILLSNHTAYDGTTVKLPLLGQRQPGTPHPYVIGKDVVSRYFAVAEECALGARIAEAAGFKPPVGPGPAPAPRAN